MIVTVLYTHRKHNLYLLETSVVQCVLMYRSCIVNVLWKVNEQYFDAANFSVFDTL